MKPRHAAALALVGWYLMGLPGTAVAQAMRESSAAISPRKDEIDQVKAEVVIAHNGWLLKIPHVEFVGPTVTFDENDNYSGPAIGVVVDKDKNIGEVKRTIPNKLDGLPIIVSPKRLIFSTGVFLSAN